MAAFEERKVSMDGRRVGGQGRVRAVEKALALRRLVRKEGIRGVAVEDGRRVRDVKAEGKSEVWREAWKIVWRVVDLAVGSEVVWRDRRAKVMA